MMEVNIFYGGFRSKAGGAFNHASSIEKEFLEIGWKVTIVTLDSLPVWCRYLPHLVQRSINYIRLPFGFLFKAYITKYLYEFFFNNNVDLRIFEDIYIAWDSNIPSVTVLHAVWSDNFQAYSIKESQLKKFKTSETSLINKLLQPVITVSQPYLNYLLHDHFLGDISKDINVIELGIDQAEFIKYKRSVKNNKKIIYTGALEARKNLFFLLEVMNELIKADSTYSLTLVGDGPDRFLLEKYVKKNDLPVSFLGKLKHAQVVSELFNHSIYVHTSVKESFSFSLLEAKLAGLTTVACKELEVPPEFIDIALNEFLIEEWVEGITAIKFNSSSFDDKKYLSSSMLSTTLELVDIRNN